MRRRFAVLLVCFVLSGFAALVYQTLWSQQLSRVFGATELAVVAVLAAFMAGLTAGAAIADRWVGRLRRPMLVYAGLELVVAAGALAVPTALGIAGEVQLRLFGGRSFEDLASGSDSVLFFLASTFVILFVPTAAMGATLPILAKAVVVHDAQLGPRIGWLYAGNTAGAAVGALTAAFVLLPPFGLHGAIVAAVAANLLAAVFAGTIGRRPASLQATEAAVRSTLTNRWMLPAMLVSGAIAFVWEVVWTRLLTHLLGGSLYAFATMLAIFLTGIAIGGAIGARFGRDPSKARRAWVGFEIGAAIFGAAGFAAAAHLPTISAALAAQGLPPTAAATLTAALVLLPLTICLGTTVPTAIRIVAPDAEAAGRASASVLVWNTIGAVLGAIGGGLLLLPTLGFAATARSMVGAGSVLAALVASTSPRRSWRLVALALLPMVLAAVWHPSPAWRLLQGSAPGPLDGTETPVFFRVGKSATVTVQRDDGGWRLFANGLPEAAIHAPGGRPAQHGVARWLSLLPALVRPQGRSMLVIGLGGGQTLEDVPPGFERVDAVELEAAVVAANRFLANDRRDDPLRDPRLRLRVDDARSTLRLVDDHWDAIVSQPSHPWTAGAANLFTRELFELVAERLEDDGVFVQWIGLQFLDAPLLRSLVATLLEAFPAVEVYQPFPGDALLFVAGGLPLSPDPATVADSTQAHALGLLDVRDVLAARVLDHQGARRLAGDAAPITDQRNRLQTQAPRALGRALGRAGLLPLIAELDPARTSADRAKLDIVARRLRQGAFERARQLAASVTNEALRRGAYALVDLATGHGERAVPALEAILARPRWRDEALPEPLTAALLQVVGPSLKQGRTPPALLPRIGPGPGTVIAQAWTNRDGEHPAIDDALAAIPPTSVLFPLAVREQIARLVPAEPERIDPRGARSALDRLEPLMAFGPDPDDLLLRVRLLMVAEPEAVAAALHELIATLDRRPAPRVRRETLAWLAGAEEPLSRQLGLEKLARLRARLAL